MSQTNPRESAIWRYNDVELHLDMSDVAEMEHYEKVIARFDDSRKKLPKDGPYSQVMRVFCTNLRDFFDDMFGAGTAEKLFADRLNGSELTEAYEDFLRFVAAQGERISAITNRISERYSPNRAQRRAAARR